MGCCFGLRCNKTGHLCPKRWSFETTSEEMRAYLRSVCCPGESATHKHIPVIAIGTQNTETYTSELACALCICMSLDAANSGEC